MRRALDTVQLLTNVKRNWCHIKVYLYVSLLSMIMYCPGNQPSSHFVCASLLLFHLKGSWVKVANFCCLSLPQYGGQFTLLDHIRVMTPTSHLRGSILPYIKGSLHWRHNDAVGSLYCTTDMSTCYSKCNNVSEQQYDNWATIFTCA